MFTGTTNQNVNFTVVFLLAMAALVALLVAINVYMFTQPMAHRA